jgi:hypothetical protein
MFLLLVKGASKLAILGWRPCGQGQIDLELDPRTVSSNEKVTSYISPLKFFKANIARPLMCSGECGLNGDANLFSRPAQLWYDDLGGCDKYSGP